MGKIKEALMKATDPVRKQQAASWKVFKAAEANQGPMEHLLSLPD